MGEVREIRPTAGQPIQVDLVDFSGLHSRAVADLATIRRLASVAMDMIPPGSMPLHRTRTVLLGQQAACDDLSRKLDALGEHLALVKVKAVGNVAVGRDAVAIARLWDATRQESTVQDLGTVAAGLLPTEPEADNMRAVLAGQKSLCFDLSMTFDTMISVLEGRPE